MKKNILVCAADLGVGGIQTSLRNLINWFDKDVYNIDLSLTNYSSDCKGINDLENVNVYQTKRLNVLQKFIPLRAHMMHYKPSDKLRLNYDLAIDFEGYQVENALTIAKVQASKKVIWVHSDYSTRYFNNYKFKLLWKYSKSKYEKYTDIAYVSENVKRSFNELIGVHNLDELVIPNFIDTAKMYKLGLDNDLALAIDNKYYNICFLGRLTKLKNIKEIINLVSNVIYHREDIRLYIIGDGEERENLEKLIVKLNVEEYVHMIGHQDNPYKYLNKMDGIILMSDYEGSPMTVLEAQAFGLDIFISDNLDYLKVDGAYVGNLLENLKHIKKKEKQFNDLKIYNDSIESRLNKLLGEM